MDLINYKVKSKVLGIGTVVEQIKMVMEIWGICLI